MLHFSFQNQLERLLLIIVALGLFWPKFINLNPWLGYRVVNNFLDATISLGHVLALLIVISELIRLRYHYTIICLSLLTVTIWQINLANPSLEELNRAVLTWLSISIWLAVWFRYRSWLTNFWVQVIMIIWLLYTIFEHLLISNPYPGILVWLVFQILLKSKLINLYTSNNCLISQWKDQPSVLLKPTLTTFSRDIITRNLYLNHQGLLKPTLLTNAKQYLSHSKKWLKLAHTVLPGLKTTKNQSLSIFKTLTRLNNFFIQKLNLFAQTKPAILNLLQLPTSYLFTEILLGIICLALSLNLFVAAWQVFTGASLGWSTLGEPVVSLQKTIAAKQPIGDYYVVLLRGYGLMQHPNLLGFLGIMGFWLSWVNNQVTSERQQKLFIYLRIISSLLVGLSFSRLAWISWLIIIVAKLIQSKVEQENSLAKTILEFLKKYWLIWVGIIGFMGLVFFSRIAYSHSTDWVRFQEYIYFWSTYSQLPWSQKLFGIGLGQYPFYFRSYHSWLPAETYQPMHNLFASLFVDLGIVFSSLFFIYLYLFTKQNQKPAKL